MLLSSNIIYYPLWTTATNRSIRTVFPQYGMDNKPTNKVQEKTSKFRDQPDHMAWCVRACVRAWVGVLERPGAERTVSQSVSCENTVPTDRGAHLAFSFAVLVVSALHESADFSGTGVRTLAEHESQVDVA